MSIGLFYSLLTIVFWALDTVFSRYAMVNVGANSAIFACLSLFLGASTLIIIAGAGKLGGATMRSPHTWLYGIFHVIMNITAMFVLSLITTTETNFLIRATIITSLLMAWMFFNRKPSLNDFWGSIIITIGLVMIATRLDSEIRTLAIVGILFISILHSARTAIAEAHPISNKADSIRARCRVTGYILMVTSLLFLMLFFVVSQAKGAMGSNLPAVLVSFPDIQDFTHKGMLYSAALMGVLFIAPGMYFYFYAAKLVKSENFMMVTAFLPFMTYLVEYAFSKFGLLNITDFDSTDLAAGGFIIAGALFIIYTRHRNKISVAGLESQKGTITEPSEDYTMLCATLERTNGNMAVASELLGVPIGKAITIHEAGGDKAFNKKDFEKVSRNYQRKVAMADTLTGIANRSAFMSALRGMIKEDKPCTVLFIDLDKFKPVNDTYGHEAGDEVLRQVATRLEQAIPNDALAARLGGDEFAVLLRVAGGIDEEEAIKDQMGIPFNIPSIGEDISVGASIGSAIFPDDAKNAEDLVKFADKGMYADKNK